jgi:hypothetical protein
MFFLHFIGGVALTDLRCVTGRSLSLPVLILPLIVSRPSKLNQYPRKPLVAPPSTPTYNRPTCKHSWTSEHFPDQMRLNWPPSAM